MLVFNKGSIPRLLPGGQSKIFLQYDALGGVLAAEHGDLSNNVILKTFGELLNFNKPGFYIDKKGSLNEWLSGSGGTGETLHSIAPFLENHACAKRQSRCLLADVGCVFAYE
jgi:hypothetical protein